MKPILFNTEMVRAIKDGRKTVTRRVVKKQQFIIDSDCIHESGFKDFGENDWACKDCGCGIGVTGHSIFKSPYLVGDILYIRETMAKGKVVCGENGNWDNEYYVSQCIDENDWIPKEHCITNYIGVEDVKWTPSIHVPKEAARLFLKVTDVRVERLQDIDLDEIEKEGIEAERLQGSTNYRDEFEYIMDCNQHMSEKFINLWNSTLKKDQLESFGWNANPWVWVTEFKLVDKPEEENQ